MAPHTLENRRKTRGRSLRARLTIWVMSIFLLIQLITGAGYWLYQRSASREMFERQLLERAQSMAEAIESEMPLMNAAKLNEIVSRELGQIEFEWFEVDLVNARGESVVSDSARWPETIARLVPTVITDRKPARTRLIEGEFDHRLEDRLHAEVIAVPVFQANEPPLALVVVSSDAGLVRQLDLISRVLIIGGAFGVLASAASGWLIAGIAVEPLRRLSGVAGQLGPATIDKKIEVDFPSIEVTQLMEELDAARARIREAFAAQERFLSNISHEIKTPIATLLTEAQTIDRSKLSPESLDFVATVEDEMRKLGRLVESFLTLTRVRDGGGVQRPRTYLANELVMDCLDDCAPMAAQYGVRLAPSLAGGDAGIDAEIVGDPMLLRTMLNNIMRNAIRFSPRDSKVTIDATILETKFQICVADEGIGIAPDVVDHVFDRFVQSSDEVRRQRGHGLGLAIAKGIAELHHGDITVKNRDVGGAEFCIQLPLKSSNPPIESRSSN